MEILEKDQDRTDHYTLCECTPDTTDIIIGDFLSYKTLCDRMKIPIKSGNAKKSQLKDILRYIDYEKIGTKYLIHDIYECPLEKEYKYPANAIYIKYIETILLSLLSSTEGNTIKITSQGLYRTLGMINDKFINIQKLSKDKRLQEMQKVDKNMTHYEIDNFLDRCKSKFSSVTKGALKSLEQRSLIKCTEMYEYGVYEYEEEFGVMRRVYKTRIANADDIEYILKVKRDTLLKFDCEKEHQIYLKKKHMPYYNEINKRVLEEKGWVSLYRVYVINYNRENSYKAKQSDQLALQRYGLNEELIKFIDNQAISNYQKYKESDVFQYPANYIDMQRVLSSNLLSIK